MRTIAAIEKERNESQVTSVERFALKRGRAEGKAEGLAVALEALFGSGASPLIRQVRKVRGKTALDSIAVGLRGKAPLEEISALVETARRRLGRDGRTT
jgi:hypothetical protein